jgi:hypothetical protein
MDKLLDYENDVKIDPQSLETCLVNQAEDYAKWNKAWAQATRERDQAKENLNVVWEHLAKKARTDWDLYGFFKVPTDGMIKEWVPAQQKYIDANIEYIDSAYKVNILAGAKQAFEHRKSALSDLVKLYLSGYYADENLVGKEARELLQEIRTKDHIEQLNKTDQRKKLKLKRRK